MRFSTAFKYYRGVNVDYGAQWVTRSVIAQPFGQAIHGYLYYVAIDRHYRAVVCLHLRIDKKSNRKLLLRIKK